jgi:hypothetical protein
VRLVDFEWETGTATVGAGGTVTILLTAPFTAPPTVTVSPVDSDGNYSVYVESVSLISGQWNVVVRASAEDVDINYQATGI